MTTNNNNNKGVVELKLFGGKRVDNIESKPMQYAASKIQDEMWRLILESEKFRNFGLKTYSELESILRKESKEAQDGEMPIMTVLFSRYLFDEVGEEEADLMLLASNCMGFLAQCEDKNINPKTIDKILLTEIYIPPIVADVIGMDKIEKDNSMFEIIEKFTNEVKENFRIIKSELGIKGNKAYIESSFETVENENLSEALKMINIYLGNDMTEEDLSLLKEKIDKTDLKETKEYKGMLTDKVYKNVTDDIIYASCRTYMISKLVSGTKYQKQEMSKAFDEVRDLFKKNRASIDMSELTKALLEGRKSYSTKINNEIAKELTKDIEEAEKKIKEAKDDNEMALIFGIVTQISNEAKIILYKCNKEFAKFNEELGRKVKNIDTANVKSIEKTYEMIVNDDTAKKFKEEISVLAQVAEYMSMFLKNEHMCVEDIFIEANMVIISLMKYYINKEGKKDDDGIQDCLSRIKSMIINIAGILSPKNILLNMTSKSKGAFRDIFEKEFEELQNRFVETLINVIKQYKLDDISLDIISTIDFNEDKLEDIVMKLYDLTYQIIEKIHEEDEKTCYFIDWVTYDLLLCLACR